MALVDVGLGGTQTIDQSGTDSVAFQGIGTLNIAGSPANPIDVILSQVGGVGLLDTVDITDANVLLDGVAGVSALANYNVGSGSHRRRHPQDAEDQPDPDPGYRRHRRCCYRRTDTRRRTRRRAFRAG